MGKYWGLLITTCGVAWVVAVAVGWSPSETQQAVAIGLVMTVAGVAYALASLAVEDQ